MAGGGGGGGDDDAQRPPRGRRCQKAAWLPLDIIITEIAARSDPATLVRCAATCRDARRRVVAAEEPGGGGGHLLRCRLRLRLRETERFVLPLLRGHLTEMTTYTGEGKKTNLYMVDTGTAAATRLVKVVKAATSGDEAAGQQTKVVVPLDSRGGLVLLCATTTVTSDHGYYTQTQEQRQLFVCDLATGRRRTLPPEPAFPGGPPPDDPRHRWNHSEVVGEQYVLLVGGADAGAAVGRRFRVLKVKLVLSQHRSHRRLLLHTFSSEHGAWSSPSSSSPCTEIPTPNLLGRDTMPPPLTQRRPLVVGGDDHVHWLCLTDAGSYVLTLHVTQGAPAPPRVSVTDLPASFPRNGTGTGTGNHHRYLLATAWAGGNPVVLVADADKISAWDPWSSKPRPAQVVMEKKTMLEFDDDGLAELVGGGEGRRRPSHVPELLWFGERSGAVLLRILDHGMLWLDLQSKKIVRCYCSDRRMHVRSVYCPYEMDLSSWVPTFSNVVTL